MIRRGIGAVLMMMMVFAGGLGCGDIEGVSAKRTTLIIVLDPTILHLEDAPRVVALMEALRTVIEKLPPTNSELVLISATAESRVVWRTILPIYENIEEEEKHEDDAKDAAAAVVRAIQGEWNAWHAEERSHDLASCLLGGLERVGAFLEAAAQDADVGLLLITDLVEACNECNEMVNLELGQQELARFREVAAGCAKAKQLEGLAQVWIVQVPHQAFQSLPAKQALETVWGEIFSDLGAKHPLFSQEEIPARLEAFLEQGQEGAM